MYIYIIYTYIHTLYIYIYIREGGSAPKRGRHATNICPRQIHLGAPPTSLRFPNVILCYMDYIIRCPSSAGATPSSDLRTVSEAPVPERRFRQTNNCTCTVPKETHTPGLHNKIPA